VPVVNPPFSVSAPAGQRRSRFRIEDGKPYRQLLVPASVLNQRGSVMELLGCRSLPVIPNSVELSTANCPTGQNSARGM
jgi:hypothetical protein